MKLRFSCILSIFILQFAFPVPFLKAQDVIWTTVEGSAAMEHISKEGARNCAIEDAVRKAVEKVIGGSISTEALLVNLRLSGSIAGAIPHGKVIQKEIIEEAVVNIHRKEAQGMPSVMYKVKIKAAVAEETTGADPSFRLDASLNRLSFKDGEDMLLHIKPTKDCYVSAFVVMEDEKVLRLIPNRFKKDHFVKANETFSFPDEADKSMGISLKAHVPQDKKTVTEAIYIVALKQPFNFSPDSLQEGIYGVYNGQTAFMQELIKEIVGIPLSDRAEALVQYQIRSGSRVDGVLEWWSNGVLGIGVLEYWSDG